MRWVYHEKLRDMLSEHFSATTINQVIMVLKLNSHGSNFAELSSVRGLLQEDIDKTTIDRLLMALSTAPVPATV